MSSPFGKAPRRPRGDRPQVQGARASQPSGTNRPSSSFRVRPGGRCDHLGRRRRRAVRPSGHGGSRPRENAPRWSAAMAGEAHPVPCRTRKLSPRAPMVLRSKSVGEQDAADQRGAFSRERPPGVTPRGPLALAAPWRFFSSRPPVSRGFRLFSNGKGFIKGFPAASPGPVAVVKGEPHVH